MMVGAQFSLPKPKGNRPEYIDESKVKQTRLILPLQHFESFNQNLLVPVKETNNCL